MKEKDASFEAKVLDNDIIELQYRAVQEVNENRSWLMSRQEVKDLVDWWRQEGVFFKENDPPVRNRRIGSVKVSMFTTNAVLVRCIDSYGKLKIIGYTFPFELMKWLSEWMTQQGDR